VLESFHMQGDLFYTVDAFRKEFKSEGYEQGFEKVIQPTPLGTLEGFRVKDHGRRPLPEGVLAITKVWQKEVALNKEIDNNEDMLDAQQLSSNFQHQAGLRIAMGTAAARVKEEVAAEEDGFGFRRDASSFLEKEECPEDDFDNQLDPFAVRCPAPATSGRNASSGPPAKQLRVSSGGSGGSQAVAGRPL
jgi:hypothetical protein